MNTIVLVICLLVIFLLTKVKSKKTVMVSQETLDNVKKMIDDYPVFVAAKTYCPYCKASLKTLFEDYNLPVDNALVLELDTMEDGPAIQEALAQINGQSTVPHIYIGKEFIGGNSDLQALNQSGELKTKLQSI